MFMVFKRGKYLKEVYAKINFFIDKAGVPKSTPTLSKIIQEHELNSAQKWDPEMDWHLLIGEQIHSVAWEHKGYLYDNCDSSRAAIFCISEYICNLGKKGVLKTLKHEQSDMYKSLQLLWGLCGHLATDPSHKGTYANIVQVLESGNPFDEEEI